MYCLIMLNSDPGIRQLPDLNGIDIILLNAVNLQESCIHVGIYKILHLKTVFHVHCMSMLHLARNDLFPVCHKAKLKTSARLSKSFVFVFPIP